MKFIAALAASAALTVTLAATIETVTLLEFLPDSTTKLPTMSFPSISPTLHAIGTGPDGMTTYLEEYGVSVAVELAPFRTGSDGVFVSTGTFGITTRTLAVSPGPTTVSFTFAEDATHYVYHHEPSPSGNPLEEYGEDEDCVIDAKGSATCVDKFWVESRTKTTTWTGAATTIHTAVVVNAKGNNVAPGARFVKESCIAWGTVVSGVLSAWILLL